MSNAAHDIARMEATENMIANELARLWGGYIQYRTKGRDKEKDVIILIPTKVEIKCDEMAFDTDNLFFEVHNSKLDEPSGLAATTSKWWAHYVPGYSFMFVFCPKRMLRHLKSSSYRYLCRVGDNNSDGWIVPIDDLYKMEFVKGLPIEDLSDTEILPLFQSSTA